MQTLSRTRSLRTRTAAGLLGIGLIGSTAVGAAPAHADDTVVTIVVPTQNAPEAVAEKSIPGVDLKLVVIRSKGAAEIAKRQVSLATWQGKLAAAKADCGFNAARAAEMTATSAGLATLGGQLAATTDLAAARTLYGKIFIDYRVYLVVLPKTGKALRCDNLLESIAKFNESAVKLQGEIDAAKAGGADTAASQAIKDGAVASVSLLSPAGAITPCMGLVPDRGDKAVQAANASALQGCDASLDSIGASLKSGRAQLDQARAALRTARTNDKASDKAAREAQRDAEKAAREAKRDADKAAREAKRDADKAARDAAKLTRKG